MFIRVLGRRVWICALALFVAPAIMIGGFACFFLLRPFPGIPTFEKVRLSYIQSEGKLLDRNGELIHEFRIHRQGRRLEWTPLRDISPALQSAVISAEDHRFYRHHGVDWISFAAAFTEMFQSQGGRGASTITMQLAALQDETLRPDRSRRSLFQKFRQARSARSFEKSWSKAQILESYLNLVTFRGELQGVAAAARGLFSKEPQGLNSTESVILGALLRSPNAGAESVAARAFELARAMSLKLDHSEIDAYVRDVFSKPYRVRPQVALAPHIALQLFETARTDGKVPETLSCTLDGHLQAFSAEVLQQHVLSARAQNMHDGSVLVVDNSSGEVWAYVGNTGERSSAFYVDGIRARRQAGSTLKPFLYALAFERRLLTPVSLIEDDPLDIPVPGGVYRPRNYDNRFNGTVTARVALASSLNVPAVKTLNLLGVDAFVDTLRVLGFEDIQSAEFYGPSLALGSADVTLWDLVNAYRTIASLGIWSPLRLTPGSSTGPAKRVFSPDAAFLISDILSDRESRGRTFDLESPLSTRFWTAVKTGTSKDMRDNWCIGFSDRYTVGVWAGNFSGEAMWNVSGITGAAPVWIEIMKWLHRQESSRKQVPPPSLVKQQVEISIMGQSRQEWFIKGTETASIQHIAGAMVPRIAYPSEGTVIALDPDIPREDQMVFFEANPALSSLEWILDGKMIGDAGSMRPWSPSKGKHELRLLDQAGKVKDSVNFEVRGN